MYKIFKATYKNKERGYSSFAIEVANDMVCIIHLGGRVPYASDLLNAFLQMDMHKRYINRKNAYTIYGRKGMTGHLYLELRSFLGVYDEDPSEMEVLKNVPLYGEAYNGKGIYKTKSKIEFNSTGKVDDSFIGVEKSYWVSDILEFLIYGVDHFGSIQATIQMIKQDQMIILDPKTMGPELLETVINNLLHPEDEEDFEEDEEE